MTGAAAAGRGFPARLERFGSVGSTQTIVRAWLDAGTPEVAVAVADEQTAGRGRLDRRWLAPPGAALLLSAGFRPRALAVLHGWRLAAVVSLAMLDAAEEAAGLREGRLALKWPNDLVAVPDGGDEPRKLAGVLGEAASGADGTVESAVVGIGVDADWPAADFPPELAATMTSLRVVAGGRPVDRDALLDGFLARLEARYEALQSGRFDAGGWAARQVTTGRLVEVALGSGSMVGRAVGVDVERGSLLVSVAGREQAVESGDVIRCRMVG